MPGRLVRDSTGRLRVRGTERDAQVGPPAGPGDSGRARSQQTDAVQVRFLALDRTELHARAEEERAVRVRDAARAPSAQLEEAAREMGRARRRGQRCAAR